MQMADLNISINLDVLFAGAAWATLRLRKSPYSKSREFARWHETTVDFLLVRPGGLWSLHHEPYSYGRASAHLHKDAVAGRN
ncbi:hypothetical protein DBR45_00270 [Pseudomonas sp. HMWF031]|nr:hypothetical protein DBR45_00270 [Pseudomonas sp. HMWF031]